MGEDRSGDGTGPALDVKQPGLKFLEAAVYIMGGLLVLMVIGLIGGIVWKATRKAPAEATVPAIVDIDTAPGARIGQMTLNGDRAVLQLNQNGQDEVVVVDVKKGTILTRIRVKPATPAP